MEKRLSGMLFIILSLTFILPLVMVLIWSVTVSWPFPEIIPQELSLRGLREIFKPGSRALESLITSIRISLFVMILTLGITIPGGKALGIYQFPGKGFIKIFVLAPLIVSPVAVGMGIQGTFIRMGLTNTELGVTLIHIVPAIPYGVRIFTNIFELVGDEMEEQGKVLGAGSFQTFIHITLPTIRPGILSAGSMIFIISFSQYFLTFLIGGGRVQTFPLLMVPYIQSGDRMMAASYSLVFIAVALLALLIIEKMLRLYYSKNSGIAGVFYRRKQVKS
ncbi:ABC transporter permease [Isachenkonia alkalipeptolytica]|uniref:ABC transporter permease subunit n=1 Tax=Isachenkonia alkalipeptolytica TaxID=2565777 RepID=A0AA43XKD1_9CLOT|nr:ABC transporter permease subunit [Isachenkonia alkalipeptolytica]NBG87834.1 ABC transporter permease subunit [Isachenkonia alkalipeptolytica]